MLLLEEPHHHKAVALFHQGFQYDQLHLRKFFESLRSNLLLIQVVQFSSLILQMYLIAGQFDLEIVQFDQVVTQMQALNCLRNLKNLER